MPAKCIEGKHGSAIVFLSNNEKVAIDQHAEAQIKMICDNPVAINSKIRVMPDVHAGKVSPIGLSMEFDNPYIIPNLIGSDIGCGVESWELERQDITRSDLERLDKFLTQEGFANRHPGQVIGASICNELARLTTPIKLSRISEKFGTLGGGNHFIEIEKFGDHDNRYLLTVHSGSRNLGGYINDYFNLKGQKILKARGEKVPYEMTYIEDGPEDDLFDQYLEDVKIANFYAKQSRAYIAEEVCKVLGCRYKYFGGSVHNTVGESNIESIYSFSLHKGSCSTWNEYPIIIPVNMRDGIIIAKGKQNNHWNNSCPHGAGRIMKRTDVKHATTLHDLKNSMRRKGIYSTSLNADTLDESPVAYRSMEDIIDVIGDTVEIIGFGHPIYVFKGGNDK